MLTDRRAWRVGVLAWVAGLVDTFGYLALDRVFVSHITGNASVLAISLVTGDTFEVFHRGWAIPTFFVGSMIGAALVEDANESWQVVRALSAEVGLLLGFVVFGWLAPVGLHESTLGWAVMVALLGSAVGIQNAALTRRDTRGTHTTHLTGAVTDFAVEMTRVLQPHEQPPPGRTPVLAARIAGFFAGGIVGALLFPVMPINGLLVPAAALVVFMAAGLA
jgi:uncharacterized membrane protein YoaK (UPF0700 family)